MDTTQEVIERVNKYLALIRYKYLGLERLRRENMLNDYYESLNSSASEEVFVSRLEVAEQLSEKLVLPLKVRGIFLTEGKPKARYYKAEDLELSTKNPLNASFPIMLDHEDDKAGKIIGKVDRIKYDPKIKGIRWWGHINDQTFALNIIDGVITQVSATIYSVPHYDKKLGFTTWKDLIFKELSLVINGSEPLNIIEVDKG